MTLSDMLDPGSKKKSVRSLLALNPELSSVLTLFSYLLDITILVGSNMSLSVMSVFIVN